MDQDRRLRVISDVMARYRAGRLSRRAVLGVLAGLGFTATGALALVGRGGGRVKASGASGHSGHFTVLAQEATPEAPLQEVDTPPAPATPQLGEQPDGTVVWRVQVGGVSHEELIEAMAFLPEEITINVGDSVFFEFQGFHTVTFLAGQEAPPLLVPETAQGTPIAGATPTAGGEWIVVNPAAAFPAGDGTYSGTSFLNSGLPDPSAPPFTVTFTEPGTHEYLCLVHPAMMKARVVVQEQGADRPYDQAFYDQQAAEQLEQILEQGRALVERHSQPTQATPAAGAGGTVWEITAGVGEGQAQVLRFLPDRLEIKAGDSVRWVNRAHTEPHTVTFLGGAEPPELILFEPQPAGPPSLVLNPEVMQPAGGPAYGGEGYTNSGWLQEESPEFAAGFEAPHTYELSFDGPGEFSYYCALHGGPSEEGGTPAAEGGAPTLVGMAGTIVVS